jgi:hypothetical protein
VAKAGYHKHGPTTLDFYQRMGHEIETACEDGRLDCRPRFTSLIPPWHAEYNALLLPTWFSVLERAVRFESFTASTENHVSRGHWLIRMQYEVVTNERPLPNRRAIIAQYPEYNRLQNQEKIEILEGVGTVYKVLVPPLFLLAVALFFFLLIRSLRRRQFSVLTLTGAAALAGIAALTFILTLLTITSYSEIERALHPVYPMVLLFIAATFAEVCRGQQPGKQPPSQPSREGAEG